jgi:hypothetical protein
VIYSINDIEESEGFMGGIMAQRQDKKSGNQNFMIWTLLLCTFLVFLLPACTQKSSKTAEMISQTAGQRADIDSGSLEPGLSVYYMDGKWRRISQMPRADVFVKKGRQGQPITSINHRFRMGNVFDSGRNQGVGVQMMGFIHLPKAGEWQFQARSNDGIVVFISDLKVVSDPGVHSDQFSKPRKFQAQNPGWYSILLRYIQRKGSATLEIYWKPPGKAKFTIIPDEAYWHMPKSL